MKKTLTFLTFITLLFCGQVHAAGTCNSTGVTGTSPYTAASLSRADVQGCLTGAERGSTVILPAGDATWTSMVTYNKALIIQGAGANDTGTPCTTGTCIRNGQSKCSTTTCENHACATYMLSYTVPNEAGATADLPYMHRINGIRFDMQYQGLGISLRNTVTTFPLTKIMIDNNVFVNCWDCDTAATLSAAPAIYTVGRLYGVIHSNSFYGFPILAITGATSSTGLNAGVVHFNYSDFNTIPGSSGFMFLEDNYFLSDGPRTYTGAEPFLVEQANGMNVVMRYNTWISNRTNSPHAKPWSPHHPAGGVNVGGKGGEFYGNYLKQNAGTTNWIWATPRSGKNRMFYNRIYAPSGTMQWTMYNPTSYPPTTTNYACGSGVYSTWVGQNYCDPSGQPQHLWQSYQWVNKYGNTGTGTYSSTTVADGGRLTANLHYFNYNTSFDGTTGVGCGTFAAMMTILPCTNGTAVWVPNPLLDTSSSCYDLDGWTGRNNAKAASVNGKIGKLYQCQNNTWVEFYEPYTYPHPLRGGADTTSGQLSNPTACSGEDCTTPLPCAGDDENVVIGVTATDNVGITGVKCCLENGSTCTPATTYANMDIVLALVSGTALEGVWGTTVTNDCNTSIANNCKGTDLAGNITPNIVIGYDMDAEGDITDPTLSTQVLSENGRTLTLTFSEPVRKGAGYLDTQWTFTVGGASLGIECPDNAGWDTDTLVCQTSECVADNAVLTLDYAQPGEGLGITDQSDNTFTIGDAASVTNNSEQTCGAVYSLFDHNDTPTYIEWPWDPATVGVRFKSAVAGTIDQICFYKDIEMDETHAGGVWDDSGTLLGSLTFTDEAESGYICQALETGVNILADTYYTVGVHFPRERVHTNYYFSSGYTNGNLSVDAGGARYNYSASLSFPNSQSVHRNFWVDFVMSFADAGGPWQMTVSNLSATGYKCNVSASDIIDDGISGEVEVQVANGWKATFSGCGAGETVKSGNVYTYTTAAMTADCTVEVTCSQRYAPGWGVP
jgi:hypothetical protein